MVKKKTAKKTNNNGKKPGGRPRNPNAKTPEILWENFVKYITYCEEKVFGTVYDDHSKPHGVVDHKNVPTLTQFADYLGYATEDSFDDLMEADPGYSPIISRIKQRLKDFLIRAGLSEKVSTRFAQFILQCGYNIDKPLVPQSEQTIRQEVKSVSVEFPTSEDAKNMSDAELAKRMSDILLSKNK